MKCYDTNVFINKALINESIRKQIINDFKKKECVFLRSIHKELLETHFPNISTISHIMINQFKRSKIDFVQFFESQVFLSFKQDYRIIAEYIENNYKKFQDIKIIEDLIKGVSVISTAILVSKCFYPMYQEDFEDLLNKQSPEFVELLNRIKNKDKIHFALLEMYGYQINFGKSQITKIQFISCDREHIISEKMKSEIERKFRFIDPVDCETYFSS